MSKSKQSKPAVPEAAEAQGTSGAPARSKSAIILLVIAIFLGFVVMKLVLDGSGSDDSTVGGTAETTITSVHNDAVADYGTAIATGKPVYVLFHSLTCEPCVEISAVADQVMPDYADDVVFVNAITDDPSGQQLASEFSFQYIPTSFFLAPGGAEVVDSFTGAMEDAQMRSYLDTLVQAR